MVDSPKSVDTEHDQIQTSTFSLFGINTNVLKFGTKNCEFLAERWQARFWHKFWFQDIFVACCCVLVPKWIKCPKSPNNNFGTFSIFSAKIHMVETKF